MSPHGVRSRRGVAFVSSVGARVAARSARCSRWWSPSIRSRKGFLRVHVKPIFPELSFRLLIVDAILSCITIIHVKVKGLKT